ncbi:substrate-binding domain-containing protein [Methanosphaerula palustris]|uniref:ABC-type phosphate transport system periplasmic component-like protein n=1 Tax=Methanosphaerula palustris (strain ATCC BAA-1556 / DSM 19958 / E1-9c) TaxID=521011 RepID=B8GFV1_METPE|nr:substrate-binding domain-containing protein [Methanosphaerula palustris]ACL17984.1 ABC-type phosphate transport system periplasmic component-like protein [Methanosphaerula palustris E1-9c]
MNRPTFSWINKKRRHPEFLVMTTLLLCLIGLLSAAGCLATSTSVETTQPIALTTSGAPALSSVLSEAGLSAARQYPGLTLMVKNTSSDQGIMDLVGEKATIALTNRTPTSREYAQARIQGKNLHLTLIGYDPLTVIVHPANPITSISKDDLARIFSNGTITEWNALDTGSAGPLHSYQDANETPDIQCLIQGITGVNCTHSTAISTVSAVRAVAADPDGIACIHGSALTPQVKSLTIEGNEGKGWVKTGTADPLYLITDGSPSPAVLQVISELFSGTSTATMKAEGLVPIE